MRIKFKSAKLIELDGQLSRVHDNSQRPTCCATSRCQQLVARQLVAATTRRATNGCDDKPLQQSVPFLFWTILIPFTLAGHDAIDAFYRQDFNCQFLIFEILKIFMQLEISVWNMQPRSSVIASNELIRSIFYKWLFLRSGGSWKYGAM